MVCAVYLYAIPVLPLSDGLHTVGCMFTLCLLRKLIRSQPPKQHL